MRITGELKETLAAPCGIPCAFCYVYLRKKKACLGCRGEDACKPDHCRKCNIKECASGRGLDFCFACADFPCAVIKRLDKSYRTRYGISLVENGLRILEVGVQQFLREQVIKWTCPQCGGAISIHDAVCSECGQPI